MKRLQQLLVVFLLMGMLACDKSTNLDYGFFANWYLHTNADHQYEAKSVTVQTDGYFSCIKDTSIQVFFATIPPATGKYHIVDESKAANHTLGPNDVAVEFNVGITNVYLSIDGNDSASVVITDRGFRHLYVPVIKVVHFNGGTAIDTTKGSGDISFPDK